MYMAYAHIWQMASDCFIIFDDILMRKDWNKDVFLLQSQGKYVCIYVVFIFS
jgi:hypothetical protein